MVHVLVGGILEQVQTLSLRLGQSAEGKQVPVKTLACRESPTQLALGERRRQRGSPMAAFRVSSKWVLTASETAAIISSLPAEWLRCISCAHVLAAEVAGRMVSVRPCLQRRKNNTSHSPAPPSPLSLNQSRCPHLKAAVLQDS